MNLQGSRVRWNGLIVLAGLFVLLAPAAYGQSGASVAQANLDYLVRNAQTIIRGNVVSAVLQPDPQFSNLQTVVVTIGVTKTLKGQAPPTLTFRQYVWNSKDMTGAGGYHKAQQILLFLNPVSAYGLTSPVGMEQGQFRVLHDSKGNLYALNGRGNVGLFTNVLAKSESRGVTFSARAKTMLSKTGGQVPLETLEETVQALVGAQP